MPFLPSARALAATAGTAGAVTLGFALGGMASVDSELAASVAPSAASSERVAWAPRAERVVYVPAERVVYVPAERVVTADRRDCPPEQRDAVRPEL